VSKVKKVCDVYWKCGIRFDHRHDSKSEAESCQADYEQGTTNFKGEVTLTICGETIKLVSINHSYYDEIGLTAIIEESALFLAKARAVQTEEHFKIITNGFTVEGYGYITKLNMRINDADLVEVYLVLRPSSDVKIQDID
jgi:hypothetical protein